MLTANDDRLLTRQQAAEFLGISTHTLAVWACTKRYPLRYYRVGSRAMYKTSELVALVESRAVNTSNESAELLAV